MRKLICIDESVYYGALGYGRAYEVVDGSRRWCFFVTPETLAHVGDWVTHTHWRAVGEWIDGAEARMLHGVPHMIIVSEVTAEIIALAVRQLERQGRLWECTRPLDRRSADSEEGDDDPDRPAEAT